MISYINAYVCVCVCVDECMCERVSRFTVCVGDYLFQFVRVCIYVYICIYVLCTSQKSVNVSSNWCTGKRVCMLKLIFCIYEHDHPSGKVIYFLERRSGVQFPEPKPFTILFLYQELQVSCTVAACRMISTLKWPWYGQVRHRVSSGVVVQMWGPRNQTSCPLPAPRPANLHFQLRAVQDVLTPGLETSECILQPYINFAQHGLTGFGSGDYRTPDFLAKIFWTFPLWRPECDRLR